MTEYLWYHNGEWLPQSDVRPDPNDRGVTLGDQVVELSARSTVRVSELESTLGDSINR